MITRFIPFVWLTIVVGFLFSNVAIAQLKYETVTVKMSGETSEDAISRAIIEGVGRVNGKTISAYQEASTALLSEAGKTSTSEAFASNVAQATYGLVNKYEVLSTVQESEASWIAEVSVEVAKLVRDDGRLKISLINISNSAFERESKNLLSSLSDSLVSSRKFDVISINESEEAKSLISRTVNNPLVPNAERVLAFHGLGVDMYVEIDLRNLDYTYQEIILPNFNPMRLPIGSVSVDFRVVDLFSSKIKFSDFMVVNLDSSSFNGYRMSQLENQIESVIAKIVGHKMSEKILDAIYPMLIIDVDEFGLASINYGSDFISPGDKFDIYERGAVVRDPYTKESIGWSERKVGALTIERSTPKLSFGTISEGSSQISEGLIDKRYVIVRVKQTDIPSGVRERKIRRSKDISDRF